MQSNNQQAQNLEMECTSGSEEDNSATFCPLFMDGLPSDFSTNPALAALASLLEETDDDTSSAESSRKVEARRKEVNSVESNFGGGKAKRVKSRESRRSSAAPYRKRHDRKTTENKASVAEASLFLKMWNF